MSALADRPMASGLTIRPLAEPQLASVAAAERFVVESAEARARRLTIEVPGTERWLRPWFVEYVEAELNGLLELRDGWDGRRAHAVTVTAVQSTVSFLAVLMDETSAAPQLFPLPDGGVQAEWHVGGNSIEVEVEPSGEAHVLALGSDGVVLADEVVRPDEAHAALISAREFLRLLSARLTRTPHGT